MDRPIQVGDLVQVVRGHECDLGDIFILKEIFFQHDGWHCPHCGADGDDDGCDIGIKSRKGNIWEGVNMKFLKRIPPLSELESERTQENLREPA